jgi:hypothetical protein
MINTDAKGLVSNLFVDKKGKPYKKNSPRKKRAENKIKIRSLMFIFYLKNKEIYQIKSYKQHNIPNKY